jgi:hypothetical protein
MMWDPDGDTDEQRRTLFETLDHSNKQVKLQNEKQTDRDDLGPI